MTEATSGCKDQCSSQGAMYQVFNPLCATNKLNWLGHDQRDQTDNNHLVQNFCQ